MLAKHRKNSEHDVLGRDANGFGLERSFEARATRLIVGVPDCASETDIRSSEHSF